MHQFCIISIICISLVRSEVFDFSIPDTLALGVSSSSFQIEGSWNVSGKGESDWDWFVQTHPEKIIDKTNMEISSDSYRKYKEDVQLIKNIGFDYHRFSISWPRILPTGFANNVNEEGIQHYIDLIEELLANGIEPVATLYHWDHPQVLEEMGGWTNELMVEWFADYAKIIFQRLGHLVKTFTTINEPNVLCSIGYKDGEMAPGKLLGYVGQYLCMHNVLKAHATAYHIYDEEFRSEQQGELGIVISAHDCVLNSAIDATAIDLNFQFESGWVMHPIFFGDYPEIMKTRIDMISKLEGYTCSRLPEFSEDWIEYIKGTVDYFGLNHYTSNVFTLNPNEKLGNYTIDNGVIPTVNDSWPVSKSSFWLRSYPQGFGNLLRMIRDQYNNPTVYIFENGWSDKGELNDIDRIRYHHDYLKELIIAIKRDGCNVQKYSVWSLIDSFEFSAGYSAKFGLVSVNFTDPARPRTPKLSATWWKSVTESRTLQDVPVLNNASSSDAGGLLIHDSSGSSSWESGKGPGTRYSSGSSSSKSGEGSGSC